MAGLAPGLPPEGHSGKSEALQFPQSRGRAESWTTSRGSLQGLPGASRARPAAYSPLACTSVRQEPCQVSPTRTVGTALTSLKCTSCFSGAGDPRHQTDRGWGDQSGQELACCSWDRAQFLSLICPGLWLPRRARAFCCCDTGLVRTPGTCTGEHVHDSTFLG